MNTLETFATTAPNGMESVCAKFTISNTDQPFTFRNVITAYQEYTLHFWIRSDGDSACSVSIAGNTFYVGTTWQECECTFRATDASMRLYFNTAATYYIYHLQLELGNIATDWAPAPEDAEASANSAQQSANEAQTTASAAQQSASSAQSSADTAQEKAAEALERAEATIQMLDDKIRMLVKGPDGGSLMVHTDDGWSFNMGQYITQLDQLDAGLHEVTEYVRIGKRYIDGDPENTDPTNVEPEIYLGESDTEFKARITNTTFDLMDNNEVRTQVDKDGISTINIVSKGEFRQTNSNPVHGAFVWAMRQNGNYGLIWKGLTS